MTACCPSCLRVELFAALEQHAADVDAQLATMSAHLGVELRPAPGSVDRYVELLSADRVADAPLQLDLAAVVAEPPAPRFSGPSGQTLHALQLRSLPREGQEKS